MREILTGSPKRSRAIAEFYTEIEQTLGAVVLLGTAVQDCSDSRDGATELGKAPPVTSGDHIWSRATIVTPSTQRDAGKVRKDH